MPATKEIKLSEIDTLFFDELPEECRLAKEYGTLSSELTDSFNEIISIYLPIVETYPQYADIMVDVFRRYNQEDIIIKIFKERDIEYNPDVIDIIVDWHHFMQTFPLKQRGIKEFVSDCKNKNCSVEHVLKRMMQWDKKRI